MTDFFSDYLEYAGVDTSEAPAIFHRWSAISMISALLGRQCYFPFGHSNIYPNQYIMIMGSPGARKSSAINIGIGLLKGAGYTKFSSDKTSKERFLMDMKQMEDEMEVEDILDITGEEPCESYIAIGEFTDFIGQNNMEFVTMLTNLWDNPPSYKNPKIHGKSVEIIKPTVNILGGNTAQGFSLAFPPEALGNGFLSRLIFVHGEPTGNKVAFPPPPDEMQYEMLVLHLKEIKEKVKGKFTVTKEAYQLMDRMYKECVEIDDYRFKHYTTRRFIHLIKISMVIAASRISTEITPRDALIANTILVNTERKMPKALGEFGKNKNSDVANRILELLNDSKSPMTNQEIFKKVSQDVKGMNEMLDIVKSLQDAGKIQLMNMLGKVGYLPKHEQQRNWDKSLILEDYLRPDETM